MIKTSNLTFRYKDQEAPLFKDVTLTWQGPGIFEIAGVSGSGKTTFIHLLNGIIPHVYSGEREGYVEVNGIDPWNVPMRESSRQVSTILQNFEFQLFRNLVEEEVNLNDPLAKKLNVTRLRDRRIRELSAGEKQRVLILKNLQRKKDIILFDEPFSSLDPWGRKELMEIIREIDGLVVISSHAFRFPDSVKYVIHEKRFVRPEGDFKEYGVLVSPYDFQLPKTSPDGVPPILSLIDIHFSYGKRKVLEGVNLNLYPGHITGISGANGAGKTTLAALIAGFLKPQRGKIFFRNKEVKKPLAGKHVGMVFQNPYAQIFGFRIKDELEINPALWDNLKILGLNFDEGAKILRLSRGELMRLAIAAGSFHDVIIFDEPTGGLDYLSLKHFVGFLEYLKKIGKAILILSHDLEFLDSVSDRRMMLKGGKLI